MTSEPPKPEEPRSEPEIIPPGHAKRPRTRVYVDAHGTEHIYIAQRGLLSTVLVVLIVGLLSTLLLVLLLGALLIWLPVVLLFATAAIVIGLLRVYFQRGP